MNVGSELKEAQLEQIVIADEAGSGKESGRAYWNSERTEIQVGDGADLIRFRKTSSAIGDIKHSMLTLVQFQAELDTTWVLADGASGDGTGIGDVIGSDYHGLTAFSTVPDMRGQFLRGKNNARSDGQENPDGDIALGLQTEDGIKEHSHQITMRNTVTGGPGTYPPQGSAVATFENTTASTNGAALDTRPKNITVNIFIKINR